jgi:hypothetical protein
MGAGAGGYVTIQLLTFNNGVVPINPGVFKLSRISQLLFAPAETPTRDKKSRPLPTIPGNSGPTPGDPPAGKVALGGVTQAQVKKFNLYASTDKQLMTLTGMGTDLTSKLNPLIAKEAHDAFGGEWAGFAVALGPAGGRFDLVADIELEIGWLGGADKPFQIIPVVVAFGTDSFAHHYLLSLIVAQKTSDLVDTAVTQPYQ